MLAHVIAGNPKPSGRPRRRRCPAWARAVNAPETDAEAAFLAGAALAVSTPSSAKARPGGRFPSPPGVGAAAASVARAGRAEDEAALRDAFHLTGRGGDPGPAGKGSFSPAGSSSPARPGSGGPRLSPPPRFWGFFTTKRLRRGSGGGRRRRRHRPAGAVRRRAGFAVARRGLTWPPDVRRPGAGEGRARRSRRGSPTRCSRSG